MEILPILVSLFLLFLSTFVILGFKTTRPRNLPPGPRKLPLLGNLLNLIGPLPHRTLDKLAQKYGPLMHLQLGELSTVVVSSAEAAEQVMKTHDLNLATRPSILFAEIMSYGCTSITFGSYGEYWRQLRKICTMELLSVKRVQSFRPLRERVFGGAVRWNIASMEGSPIDLTKEIRSCTNDLISLAALGKKTKGKEKLLQIIQGMVESGSGFDVSDLYPSVKLLQMVSGLKRRLTKLHTEIDGILDEIIRDHRVARAAAASDHHRNNKHEDDLLDVLLNYQDDGLEIPFTDDNIKSVLVVSCVVCFLCDFFIFLFIYFYFFLVICCTVIYHFCTLMEKDMIAAGSETSAMVVDWAMAEMLRNPRVLDKAQEEVRGAFDDKGYVDEGDIHKLKYLNLIIKETMRLHTPAPLLLPRKCREECEIGGYEIPLNTKVIVNAWAISRDPKKWKNPDCFQPERFLDNTVDFRGNHFEYTPFGAGRRMCPGMNYGLASIELPLALFLYHFDWSLPAGTRPEEMDMAEGFGLTASRVHHLYVVPLIARPLPTVDRMI